MKAVLISTQPKWCEHIASGEKTDEIRKTRPKTNVPFKVYIHMTKGKWYKDNKNKQHYGKGKVIGEFVCDRLVFLDAYYDTNGDRHLCNTAFIGTTCLTDDELFDYLYGKVGRGHGGWAWHISNLVIYDEPKELSEFRSYNVRVYTENGYPMPTHEITRPPQSWCYVEEVE